MKIKIITKFNNKNMKLPKYSHPGDAGMDLQANITEPVTLWAGITSVVPTGLFLALPSDPASDWIWEIQIRPRSGLAANNGITVTNSPGTVDSGYRGEIKVILTNLSDKIFIINPGDRIAQMVLSRVFRIEWEEVEDLDITSRNQDGFNSTGV